MVSAGAASGLLAYINPQDRNRGQEFRRTLAGGKVVLTISP